MPDCLQSCTWWVGPYGSWNKASDFCYSLIKKSSLIPRLSLLSGESLGMGLDFHCIAVTVVSLTGAVTHMGDGGATDLHTRSS